MKTRLPILLLLLSSLFVAFSAGEVAAANSNPTQYISLDTFYPLVPTNPDGSLPLYYSFTNESDTFHGYIGQFRAFIPPGTILMDLNIIETGKQKAVARHMFPPIGSPTDPLPPGYSYGNYFTLDELIKNDCWVIENSQDSLYITNDAFSPPLETNKAGWLYVKVGGGEYSQIYDTHFTVRVNAAIYNEWWNTYIKDQAGWNKYVEGVMTYSDPTAAASVLQVTPSNQSVSKNAGSTTFSVSNTGTGTMPWTAAVTTGGSWLSITSGASGSNVGTINCSFTNNNSTSARTGTIRVTATGATGSPVDVTVTQEPMCSATIDQNLLLHIPYLSYVIPNAGTLMFSADLVCGINQTLFACKLTNLGIINNPLFSCAASTLSSNFEIHIPDLLLPDGTTHLSVYLDFDYTLSTDYTYFVLTGYGPVSK
ncbi:MAG: BACON domain-containing protein [Deltaproteobacteria bacterium]|nr:BACON domain-containing protein [Deltaproteobacteria bacterium]